MKNILLTFTMFLFTLSSWSAPSPAHYSESTDVFELMDHVSRWRKGLDIDYLKSWQKRFTLSSEDKSFLSEYRKLRVRYQRSLGKGSDLFGEVPVGYDILSNAFYKAQSLNEAFSLLSKNKVRKDDIIFLQRFYKHFHKKIAIVLKESTQFQVNLFDLNKSWSSKKMKPYVKRLTKFILGKKGSKYKIMMRPVWLPKNSQPSIELRGPFLILKSYPLNSKNSWPIKSLLKKTIHTLLQGQSKNQRGNLTKLFKSRCVGRENDFRNALDIVLVEMIPEYLKKKKSFNLYKKWDERYFVDIYSKLLFPLAGLEIKGKAGFSGRFISEASNICYDLHRLSIEP